MTAALQMNVVRRDEKEQKLNGFIIERIESLLRSTARSEVHCLIVARSGESPVVKALRPILLARQTPLLRCRAVLMEPGAAPPPGLDGWRCFGGRDIRLLEAHEFLILDPAAVWTGDSMRRDPARCDAYESYVEDSPQAAQLARAFFERLWEAAARSR